MHLSNHLPVQIDKACARVIQATLDRPRSAIQIARAIDLPVAVVCRRIRQLRVMGLLREEVRVWDVKGREVPLYMTPFHSITLLIEGGRSRLMLSSGESHPDRDVRKTL